MSDLLRRADALVDGMTDGELARSVRRGDIVRLHRGTCPQDAAALAGTARHAAVVTATVAGPRIPGAVSHVSAAVLHGLPIWGVPLGRVHVTRRPPTNG